MLFDVYISNLWLWNKLCCNWWWAILYMHWTMYTVVVEIEFFNHSIQDTATWSQLSLVNDRWNLHANTSKTQLVTTEMVFHGISIISAPHNMGVDTLFVQLSSLLTEI